MEHPLRRTILISAICAVLYLGGCASSVPEIDLVVTSTPTSTATRRPDFTPYPTAFRAPTATSFAFPDRIDLPSWAADPAADVYLTEVSTYDDEQHIMLLNVATHEHFIFPIPKVDGYFWLPDGKGIGFAILSRKLDSNCICIVDLMTGTMRKYAVRDSAIKPLAMFYRYRTGPLVASGNNLDDPSFILRPARAAQNGVSVDGRYAVAGHTIVEDLQTGSEFEVPRPDGDFATDARWSPTEPLLAFSQSEGNPYYPDFAPGARTWHVYDPATNAFAASYPGMGDAIWSGDGESVLYDGGETPCILKWREGVNWCVGIDADSLKNYAKLDFDWPPDGSWISFLVFAYPPGEGGLCVKSLTGGTLVCPTANLPNLPENWYVRYHSWTSDSKYLIFLADRDSCPSCDFSNELHWGIVKPDGSGYWYPIDVLDYGRFDGLLPRPSLETP